MRSIRAAAVTATIVAVALAGVLTTALDAQAASVRAAASSCVHEHVSGKRRTETLPGTTPTTVSVRTRPCFDRLEIWRNQGADDAEYLSAERYLCKRLGVEPDLHHVLGHGVLWASPVMIGGFVRGKDCLWMLPFSKWRTPSSVAFEGVRVSVLGASDSGASQYGEYVGSATDVDGAVVRHLTVSGRPATMVRFPGSTGLTHGTELFVSGSSRTTIEVSEQVSDAHPAMRTALRARLLHLAARAVQVAKTLNTGPLE